MATKNFLKNKRVLVACGPTWVPIDDTRVISNISSGELGHALVSQLKKRGAKITLLEGPTTHMLSHKPDKMIKFLFYDDLARLLKQELKKRYDVIIQAAAVSDYKSTKTCRSKLSSCLPSFKLNLKPTVKIINRIKQYSPKSFLVGFKLETKIKKQSIARKVESLFKVAGCDLVVVNSLNKENYEGVIINKRKQVLACAKSRRTLVDNLIRIINTQI